MAHQLFTLDRVMAVSDKPTWHRKENFWLPEGTQIDTITRENSGIVLGGKILRLPLFTQELMEHEESGELQLSNSSFLPVVMSPNADQYGNESENQDHPKLLVEVWTDEHGKRQVTPLCIAEESFQLMDPGYFWNIVEEGLSEIPHRVTCVGTHSNRRKIWLSLELIEKENFIAGGEQFAANINIMEGRDKTQRFVMASSFIRVVCANTFSFSVAEANKLIELAGMKKVRAALVKTDNGFVGKAKHTTNFSDYIKAMQKDLPVLMATPDAFSKVYDQKMIKRKITQEQIRKILLGFYSIKTKVKSDELISTKTINQINGVQSLVMSGKGNSGKTIADVWNGITEFYTTGDGSGSAKVDGEKKFLNSEFGTGAKIKSESFFQLVSDEQIDKMIAEGDRLLDLATKSKLDLMVA